jgi:CheY-like chemotaxis protein
MAIILVVDDDSAVLGMSRLILESEGYRVHAAESAKQAIEIAQELQCGLNLLLTDIVMPVMDGHDLIMTIRRMCPSVNMMAMSGFLPDNSSERDYLVLKKPFTRDQLLAAVKQMLDAQETGGG